MAQMTEREIQQTFKEADKLAAETSFPENTNSATNENVLSPPETEQPSVEQETAEQETVEQETVENQEQPSEAAPEATASGTEVDSSSDLLSQEDIQALVQQTATEEQPPDSTEDTTQDDHAGDEPAMMSQEDIEALLKPEPDTDESAPEPPETASEPEPKPQESEPENDEMMSQEDIEALILGEDTPKKPPETDQEESEELNMEALNRLQASMEKAPQDDSPLSEDDIQAMTSQINSAAGDEESNFLAEDDLKKYIEQRNQALSNPDELFDTHESDMATPNTQEPSSSTSGQDESMLSNDDIARMMQEANDETPPPTESQEISASLEELIAKTESIANSLSQMDEDTGPEFFIAPPEADEQAEPERIKEAGYHSQVEPLLQKRGKVDYKSQLQAAGKKNRSAPPLPSPLQASLKEAARFFSIMLTISCLAFGLGAATRLYRLNQADAVPKTQGMQAWEWTANPNTKSHVKWRFKAPATTGVRGTVALRNAEQFEPESIRNSIGTFYQQRYPNEFRSVGMSSFSSDSFLVDYVFPHPKGSKINGFIAKRSLFVKRGEKLVQMDFIRPVAAVEEATPGQPVWESMNQVLSNAMDLNAVSSAIGSGFDEAMKQLEERL